MSGPSDPPKGFVIDETPAAAPASAGPEASAAQPVDWDAIDWDALTPEQIGELVDRICEAPAAPPVEAPAAPAPPPQPPSAHEQVVASIRDRISGVSTSGRMIVEFGDHLAQVVTWARKHTGREVGFAPTWARFIRTDLERGVLLIVSTPEPNGSAELLIVANKGMLTRTLLVDAAKWVFFAIGLSKVTVHLPVGNVPLADLARRVGFVSEGISRGFYRGQGDASRWSMLASECRWLAPRSPAPFVRPTGLPPLVSLKVH